MPYKKTQEGMFIALFALATVVIITILVSYMSNWVNDMVATQTQVFFGKQAYWNAHSGMEIATSKRIASLDGIPSADVSFTTGTISIDPITTDVEPNTYLGGNKVTSITSTGSDLRGRNRTMKLEIGDAETGCSENVDGHSSETLCDTKAADHSDYITHWVSNACNETIGAHSSESLCDAGAANHSDGTSNGTGHYLARIALFFDGSLGNFVDIGAINEKMEMQVDGETSAITYVDGSTQADFSISLWVKPDYSVMGNNYGVIFAANNCGEGEECNNERGIVLGVRKDNYFLRIWHTSNAQVDFETYEVSGDPAPLSADSWHHVVYTRSAVLGSEVGKIYLNGVLLGTEDPDDSWFKSAAGGELWYLGTDIDLGPVKSQNYAGCMDEVAIWRAVLSESQIQSLYIQGMSFDIDANMGTNLVAYWDFDGDGVDGSSPGYTASITGAAYTGF